MAKELKQFCSELLPKGAGFEKKVKKLVSELKEGGVYMNRNTLTPKAHDDNLDIVAWKGFVDSRGSQLIGFAQCKTGDNWKGEIGKLSPSRFIGSWFSNRTLFLPANIFMITDIVGHDYFSTFMDLLFFDRCRLMDYLPNRVEKSVISDIKKWLTGASAKYDLKLDNLLNQSLM